MATLEDYITDNPGEILAELCQYQTCDNCSIGALFKRCPLLDKTIEEALEEEIDQQEDCL